MGFSDSAKRFMREVGPAEEYDEATWQEIFDEVENEAANLEVHFSRELSERKKVILDRVRQFTGEVSEAFRQEFLRLLSEYHNSQSDYGVKIVEWLQEKGFDLPDFDLYDAASGDEFLAEHDFQKKIDPDKMLLVFQLPKPLAKFWWKGEQEECGRKLQGSTRLWGKFYHDLMPTVHYIWDHAEEDKELTIHRLNVAGQHDEDNYYYLWEVGTYREEKNFDLFDEEPNVMLDW